MINWLIEQQWPLSLSLLTLLFINKYLIKVCGARLTYQFWLLIPLVLVINNLPNSFTSVIDQQLQTYVISVSQQVNQFDTQGLLYSIWLLGSVFVSTLIVIEHRSMQQNLKQGQSHKIDAQNNQFEVIKNSAVASPMLVGLIKTRLFLPSNFEQHFNSEQQQLILQHELTHFKRRDNWANCAAITVVLVFWFNPLVWLAYASFRKGQEVSCDEHVLTKCTKQQRINYCKAMVNTALHNKHGLYSYSYYMEKSTMKQRMQYIQTMPKGNAVVKLLIACTLIAGLSNVAFAKYGDEGAKHNKQKIVPVIRIEPKYPKQAADNGIEGSVVLKFDISSGGDVNNISVVEAKPQKTFEHAAKTALAKWKYSSSAHGAQNQLVQLDFAMNKNTKLEPLIERVTVTN